MNGQAIRILFLKDLFLSRKTLFVYLIAGLASAAVVCVPNEKVAFLGFILIVTVAIASGLHLIGSLLLGETMGQTRLFVMSLPVSLLDYSVAKIAVILTTYLIPWITMLSCLAILALIVPGGKPGSFTLVPATFGYLLAVFTIQLVTAVVTESFGWTIGVVVAGNVCLNLFLKTLSENPQVAKALEGSRWTLPPLISQVLAIEAAVIVVAIALAFILQTRKRDLI
jgi:hypothetical protein